MVKNIFKILVILMLALIQISLVSRISLGGIFPNLILISAICLIFRGRYQWGFWLAALGGLFLDLSLSLHFGVYTFIFLAVAAIIYFYILEIFPTPNLMVSFLIFLGSFLFLDVLICLIINDWSLPQILKDIVINSLWGVLIYFLSQKLLKNKEEIQLI